MKRRTFVKSALAMGALAGASPLSAQARGDQPGAARRQYYELRVYHVRSDEQRARVDEYWRGAAAAAYNRQGIAPIGAFVESDSPEIERIYILIPYDSLESFAAVPKRLAADAEYQRAGAAYLQATKSDPAYERFESALLIAFEGMKKLEAPPSTAEKKPWIFELRTYESPGDGKGINKVQMFNSGEVELMRACGLAPVFFGQALIGSALPHLTYMVSGEDKRAHQEHWRAFFQAPVWKRLSTDPQYKGNVSKVTSVFLKRADCSQI